MIAPANTINLSANVPGMQNVAPGQPKVNLMTQAVELAKDGQLGTEDLTKLRETAASDGDIEASEALFLQGLEQKPEAFATAVQEAVSKQGEAFDPSSFSFKVSSTLTVPNPSGNRPQTKMVFSDTVISADNSGAMPPARNARGRIGGMLKDMPVETQKAWQALDKHDIAGIKDFLKQTGFSNDQKVEFVQSYLEGYFNHTGENVDWDTTRSLNSQLPDLPVDKEGRKFVDCEGYSAMTKALLQTGESNSTGGSPGSRPIGGIKPRTDGVVQVNEIGSSYNGSGHAISVIHDGEKAYVQSNHEIQVIPNAKNMTDAEIIAAASPNYSSLTYNEDTIRAID